MRLTLTATCFAVAMSLALVDPAAAFKACQVADTGGLDDKSFNQTAWNGIEDAIEIFGIAGNRHNIERKRRGRRP